MSRLAVVLVPSMLLASAASGAPRIIDQIGAAETDVRVVAIPGNPVRWLPEARFHVEHPGWSQEDVVLVDWRDGKKSLGKPLPCAATHFLKAVQKDPTTPAVPANVGYFHCRFKDDAAITRAGAYQLGLTYRETLSGKTYDLGVLSFKAIEIAQGSQNKPTPTYADDRDHQLGLATIERYTGGYNDPGEIMQDALEKHHRVRDDQPNEIAIRFWTKHDARGPTQMTMSCLLGDRKVAEASNAGRGGSSGYWTHKGKERLNVRYQQHTFIFMKMISGKMKPGHEARFALGDNPGDYRCVAMAEGEIVKEVFFTVGPDGEIARTRCDDQAVLLDHVHIVRAVDKAIANLPYDEKAGKKTGYFGRVVWKDGCPSG
jgi:hypothetical protein